MTSRSNRTEIDRWCDEANDTFKNPGFLIFLLLFYLETVLRGGNLRGSGAKIGSGE
jgi:hypothetical protein